MTKRESLASWMKESVVVADGAMGTVLHLRGIPRTHCLEEANLSRADLVFALHREYVHAGAHILTSNTFKANRLHLATFELEDRLREINIRGWRSRAAPPTAPPSGWAPPWDPSGHAQTLRRHGGARPAPSAWSRFRCWLKGAPTSSFWRPNNRPWRPSSSSTPAGRWRPKRPSSPPPTFNRDGRTFFSDSPVEGCRRLARQG